MDETTRLTLLETDADLAEQDRKAFKAEIRGEITTLKRYMLGVILTASTATIVGAVNLVLYAPWSGS